MLDDISSSFLFLLGGGVLLGGALSLGMSQAPFDYYAYMDDPVTGRDARFWMNFACACPRLSLLRLRLGTPFPQGFPMARGQVEHVASGWSRGRNGDGGVRADRGPGLRPSRVIEPF